MRPARLVERRYLDPRPSSQAAAEPIADAVNIPFSQLKRRLHELPPRDQLVPVVGPAALAAQVAAWLEQNGRRAEVHDRFKCAGRREADAIGRLWRPNSFLTEVLPQLPIGSALDLGCGCGREAVFMASCGWNVTAVDVLPDALERGRDLARRCTPAASICWVAADLERDEVAFERRFDLIVSFRYLHRPLFGRLADWLQPGGGVVVETFTTLHRERHGRPRNEAHVLRPDELPGLLRGFDIRESSEGWRDGAHMARLWAVLGSRAASP